MIKDFAKLGLILAVFAAVACVGLAFVYAGTKDQIAVQAEIQVNESLKGIFPTATSFEPAEIESPDSSIAFDASYLVKAGDVVVGLATKASGASYGGTAVVLVGVGLENKIVGVRVLETKDTPGLGANATVPTYFVDKTSKTTFPGQFAGKALSDPFEVKKDVQAITASTITSKALTKIVKVVGDAGAAWLAQTSAASGGN